MKIKRRFTHRQIEKKTIKVLVVLGEGGHTVEILRVVESLGPMYDYSYLVPKHDRTSESKIKIAGPIYRAQIPRRKNSTNPKYPLQCIVQEFSIFFKVRPKAVLSAGAGIAVPISIFGWLFGAKIIYVETATRVKSLSSTGKIMYRIADLFFVQWEQLMDKYPKAIYAGRVL